MISDIVLVKELPEFIKNSIQAYIGCLYGAVIKDIYFKLIKKAGFNNIKILEEKYFPVEYMLNDSSIKAIIENSDMTHKDLKNIEDSIRSIKIYAEKP